MSFSSHVCGPSRDPELFKGRTRVNKLKDEKFRMCHDKSMERKMGGEKERVSFTENIRKNFI